MKYYTVRKYHYKRRRGNFSILKNKTFWKISVFFIVSILLFYFTFDSSFFKIQKITIKDLSRNNPQLNKEINNLVRKNEEARILLLPSSNIFLFRSQKTEENILNKIPLIGEVDISKKLPHSIIINYKERQEVALWHQINDLINYYEMDDNGIIFQKSNTTSSNKIIIEGNETFKKLGQKILDKKYLTSILDTKKDVEEITKHKVKKVVLNSPTYLSMIMDKGWKIYFNLQNNIDWQIEELRSVLENKIPPDRIGKLKYIDLRFNKVFVSPSFD